MNEGEVIILGGVGNGSVIAAAIDDANLRGDTRWRVAGYLNDRLELGTDIEGHPVLGNLGDVPRYLEENYGFINAIYRIDGQDFRVSRFEDLKIPDERLVTFVHPTAYVAPGVELGPGTVILPNVSISPGVVLGRCCLVMVSAVIGHNTRVGDCCHFAAQSCVSSFVRIGKGVHVGINASVRENLRLGDFSALAMGAVLVENMKEFELRAGVPARRLRKTRREL